MITANTIKVTILARSAHIGNPYCFAWGSIILSPAERKRVRRPQRPTTRGRLLRAGRLEDCYDIGTVFSHCQRCLTVRISCVDVAERLHAVCIVGFDSLDGRSVSVVRLRVYIRSPMQGFLDLHRGTASRSKVVEHTTVVRPQIEQPRIRLRGVQSERARFDGATVGQDHQGPQAYHQGLDIQIPRISRDCVRPTPMFCRLFSRGRRPPLFPGPFTVLPGVSPIVDGRSRPLTVDRAAHPISTRRTHLRIYSPIPH